MFTSAGKLQAAVVMADPYVNNVSLLMHFDGANNSTVFTDVKGHSVGITTGSPIISTAQSKFGGASLYLNGSSALSIADSSDFQMGTGDFTFECQVFPTLTPTADTRVWSYQGAGTNASNRAVFVVGRNSAGRIFGELRQPDGTSDVVATSTSVAANNTWTYVAFVRSGTTTYLFINGVLETTTTGQSQNINGGTVAVGYYPNSNNSYFTGYVDEMRITKGVARYTASFTPPIAAFS